MGLIRALWKGRRFQDGAKVNRLVEPSFRRVPYLREDPDSIDGRMEPHTRDYPSWRPEI